MAPDIAAFMNQEMKTYEATNGEAPEYVSEHFVFAVVFATSLLDSCQVITVILVHCNGIINVCTDLCDVPFYRC